MNGNLIATLLVLILCAGAALAGVVMSDEPSDPSVITNTPNQVEETVDEETPSEEEEEPEEELPEEDLTDTWELLLANPDHPLPNDFEVETANVQGDFVMDERVADAMKEQLGVKIDKKKIELKNAIKNEGEFTAKVRLFAGVAADLKVIVTIA